MAGTNGHTARAWLQHCSIAESGVLGQALGQRRLCQMVCMKHCWQPCAGLPRDQVSYSLPGNKINNLMGVFSGLGTIAFTFGDAMLPEIQVRNLAGDSTASCST